MFRTTVYMEKELVLRLKKLSGIYGKSQAELIREAIETYVVGLEKEKITTKLPPGIGAFRSGRRDVSEKAETLLRKKARART